jgi:tungstate transport system permease protein
MSFVWEGLKQAIDLIIHGDPALMHVLWVTIKVAVISTTAALVIGLPVGVALGLGRFRGRRAGLAFANAGMGLPPVVVGIVLSVLMFPAAPLGRFHLLFTLKGVYVAQTVLALPVVIALTAAAVLAVPSGLLDQARAFGAGRARVWLLALREGRVGVFAAAIAAVGGAFSEVGAVILVGGNIIGSTQTLAAAALQEINGGDYPRGMAIGLILFGVITIVAAALTFAQERGGPRIRARAPS